MGLKDHFVNVNRRHQRSLEQRRRSTSLRRATGRITPDALLELSSINMTVAFFENRLEYRSRLGSKHAVIPYAQLHAVRLVKRPTAVAPDSTGARARPRHETLGDGATPSISHVPKEMVLTLETRRKPLTFDFRSESTKDLERAFDIVRRHVVVTPHTDTVEERTVTSDRARSRADELLKLAQLRSAGVLSDAEFEVEKARVLNS